MKIKDLYERLHKREEMLEEHQKIFDKNNVSHSAKKLYECKKIVLECVDPINNHNKYYIINQKEPHAGKKQFEAAWGRIGSNPQKKVLNKNMITVIDEKISKGYVYKTLQTFEEAPSAYKEFCDFLSQFGPNPDELFD
jgi:predicted DNA-binding WGR domain protein